MYFFIEDERIIPGLSLLSKINGLSIEPEAIITFFALIFHNLCLIFPRLSFKFKWSVKFSFARR